MKRFLLMLILATSPVMADDDSDSDGDKESCSHPHFVTYDCLDSYGYDDEAGETGPVGPIGETGPIGPAGPPGRDFTNFLNEVRSRSTGYSQYLAATEAAQVYLPQNMSSRMTFGMSRVSGQTGIGFGYAFKANTEDAAAFTLSLGFSGGKAVGKASVSVEF